MAYRPSEHVQNTSPKGKYQYDLALQTIAADSVVRIHGFNNGVAAAATESINFQGGLYEFPEVGGLLVISSSDVLDDGVGLKATSSAIFIVNHIEDPFQLSITSSLDARIVFSGSASPAPPDSASLNLFYFVSASTLQGTMDNVADAINQATASEVSASSQAAADATSSLLALTASNPGTAFNAIRFLSGSTVFSLAGGTDPLAGARSLLITGLTGSDYSEISETWSLSGSAVGDTADEQGKNFGDSVLSYIRVNSVRVTSAGNVTGSNFGDIKIHVSGSDVILGVIPTELNELHNAVYTVPQNQTALLTSWQVSLNTLEISGSAAVQIKSRESGSLFFVDDSINLESVGENTFYKEYDIPVRYPERTDIIVQAKSDTDTLKIQTVLTLILRNN